MGVVYEGRCVIPLPSFDMRSDRIELNSIWGGGGGAYAPNYSNACCNVEENDKKMIAFSENWLKKFAEFGLQIEKFM